MRQFNHYYSRKPQCKFGLRLISAVIRGKEYRFYTAPGVFSKRRIDKGTLLLAEEMIINKNEKVLDLGCGYGVLGIVAADLAKEGYVILTDINERAVKLAKMNLKLNNIKNAEVRQGNLYEPVINEKFDSIICNPPMTAGLSVVFRIIDEAKNHLKENGKLQIVARHRKGGRRLKEKMLEVFGNVEDIAKSGGYRVYLSKNAES